jgi:hypothetical protein
MLKTSPETSNLDAALAKAQGEIPNAIKDKINPAFRSKYADLTAIWDACREALSKNGLSVTQWPVHSEDSRLHIITRIACAGEWMMAEFSIPVQKPDAHGYGSAITYTKRFALSAALGIATDEDDDGNEASQRDPAPAQPRQQPQPPTPQPPREQPQQKQKPWTTKAQMIDCFHSLSRQFETEGQLDAYQETLKKHGVQDVRMFADGSVAAKCYLELQDLLKPARNGRGLH